MEERRDIDDLISRFNERMAAREPEPERAGRGPTHIEELEGQLRDAEDRLRQTLASHRAAVDDMERAKRRIEREAERSAKRSAAAFLASFIELLDDLDRAIAAAQEHGGNAALMEGMELLRRRFLTKLAAHQVERFEPLGEPFDPRRAEAVSVVSVSDQTRDGSIVEVVSPGYALAGDVLRAAKVVVARSIPTAD
jgi:molecular chaperone GrpE